MDRPWFAKIVLGLIGINRFYDQNVSGGGTTLEYKSSVTVSVLFVFLFHTYFGFWKIRGFLEYAKSNGQLFRAEYCLINYRIV